MPVRAIESEDVGAVLPLYRAYATFYESDPSDEGLEALMRDVVGAPEDQRFMLVAMDDAGEIVGFAYCIWKWSSLRGARIVFLDDLFVAESARGQGHADALISRCAEIGRRHGAAKVGWLTAHDNHRAQKVYDRVGGVSEQMLEYELDI